MNKSQNTIDDKLWHPVLFGTFCLVIASGFWFFNLLESQSWYFHGMSLQSLGFLIFGLLGFRFTILHMVFQKHE